MPVYIPPLYVRDRAALLLASGRPLAEVATEVGVDPRTVRRWRATPDFQAQLRRVRRRLIDQAADALGAEGPHSEQPDRPPTPPADPHRKEPDR